MEAGRGETPERKQGRGSLLARLVNDAERCRVGSVQPASPLQAHGGMYLVLWRDVGDAYGLEQEPVCPRHETLYAVFTLGKH